jgi:multisubunit Na+/H+ antiporter MnhB subunit
VAQSTLEAQPSVTAQPQTASVEAAPETWTLRLFMRRHPWWSSGIGITLLSALLVFWARTRPGFDPYGWLVWGHQTLTGSLDTNAAPSWKPLPYLFTVPYALAGHYELRLWMITAAAVALAGVVFAGRIAYRLVDPPPERRWAGICAAVFAGAALLGLEDYMHYILSSQSDPMIVSLCLGAIDCHLYRRPRAAFVLGVLAALGRPEVWPFLAAYSIWMWVRLPATRVLVAGGWVAVALLWFGIPALTSRSPFVAATNALGSGRRLTSDKVFGTVGRFLGLNELPVQLAALLAVVIAAVRRDRVTLALAGGAVIWVLVEIAFALHGWPGLARYMFEAGGVVVVLAGVAVGRLLIDRPLWPRAPTWLGAVLVLVLVVSLLPAALSHARAEHKDLVEQHARTAEINDLTTVIDQLGGVDRLRACGEPLTRLEYQTMLAYTLRINVSKVGFKYGQAVAHGNPIVMFTPFPSGIGWVVQAMHQVAPACRSLPQAH